MIKKPVKPVKPKECRSGYVNNLLYERDHPESCAKKLSAYYSQLYSDKHYDVSIFLDSLEKYRGLSFTIEKEGEETFNLNFFSSDGSETLADIVTRKEKEIADCQAIIAKYNQDLREYMIAKAEWDFEQIEKRRAKLS